MLEIKPITRAFKFNGTKLPDPKPDATPEEVRDIYVATYPELATAQVEGPKAKEGQLVYKFVTSVGTKG